MERENVCVRYWITCICVVEGMADLLGLGTILAMSEGCCCCLSLLCWGVGVVVAKLEVWLLGKGWW